MRVRVSYTVDINDAYRRAINHFYGQTGMASRQDVVQWLKDYGTSSDGDLMQQLEDDEPDAQPTSDTGERSTNV